MEERRVERPHEKNPNAPLGATDSSGLNAANAIPSDSSADRHGSGRSRAERLSEPRTRRPQAPEVPVFEPRVGPSVEPRIGPDVHPAGSLSSTSEREEELRRREGELATLSQRLRDRELSLDRERESLNQLKSEVTDRHQETLEMRLACEQLWSQLASRMEAPLLVESLAKLRRRLADQYHNAAVEMAQRRDEAREWVARLDERQRELRRQRDEIQTWIYRRHEELEIERLKLLRREQELDARERAQQQQQAEMQRQLGEYQRQIRQLTAQLRCKSELDRLAQ
jgi:chromosome segregation ATPase